MIKVLLASNQYLTKKGIRALLNENSDIKIIEEVSQPAELINRLPMSPKPDIILADWNLPDNGILDILSFVNNNSSGKIIVLSNDDDNKLISEALKAGADGYLLQSVKGDELVFAIKHIANGGKYICNEIVMDIINNLQEMPGSFNGNTSNHHTALSNREKEILKLIAEGLTNQEIANKLFSSRRTIEGHRRNIIRKTSAKNTAALIKYAVRNGLV